MVAHMNDKILKLPDDDYIPETVWARIKHIHPRTSARYRNHGNLPFLEWGGAIWIGLRQGDEYIASLVQQRNSRPEPRRRRRNQEAA
jgi:hypothetical protein